MINFDEEQKAPSDGEIATISRMISTLRQMKDRVARMEIELKAQKEAYVKLSQQDLPEAMRIAGMAEFTTTDGNKVSIKDDIYAAISEANKAKAFAWLTEHNFGDLIKTSVDVNFGRGEHDKVSDLLKNLQEHGYQNYGLKEGVHPQTLKAFLREQIANGMDVPLELFSAFQFKEVVFK